MGFKTLIATSEPDFEPRFTYNGPPIGFAAKVVQHAAPGGNVTSTAVHGSILAPRPVYIICCSERDCDECKGPQLNCGVPKRSDSSSSCCTDCVSPKSSPKIDVGKMLWKAEQGVY